MNKDMKNEPKILEEGESTYRNGGGSICGGVISKTLMFSNVEAYMMAYYLEDEQFARYKIAIESGDEKIAKKIFDQHARSII